MPEDVSYFIYNVVVLLLQINSLDSKIKKLEQAAFTNVGTLGLLAIKEKMERLKYEKAQVYASVWKVIQENQKHNDGAGGSSG